MNNQLQSLNNTDVVPDDKTPVIGPDKKSYYFKAGTTRQQAQEYWKSKGIVAPVKQSPSIKQPAAIPQKGVPQEMPNPSAIQKSMQGGTGNAARGILDEGPGAGAIGGGLIGGAIGATRGNPQLGEHVGSALGAAFGDGLRQVGLRVLLGEGTMDSKNSTWKQIKDTAASMGKEGAEYGAMSYGASKLLGNPAVRDAAGNVVKGKEATMLWKLLEKIPHVTYSEMTAGIGKTKQLLRIPLLPGDVEGNKGITQYIVNFLGQYLPSKAIIGAKREIQDQVIRDASTTIAEGMSKFRGTPEQFGKLLQTATKQARTFAIQNAKSPVERDKIIDEFNSGLLDRILHRRNIEQLSGALISDGFGNSEIRDLAKKLGTVEQKETFNAAKTAILGDINKVVLTGKNDPVAIKAGARYTGDALSKALDSIDKGRFETIYTPTEAKNIRQFAQIIQNVGGGGTGMGRFANLVFVLGRGLSSSMGVSNLTKQVALTRTMAKIMMSDEGIVAYQNYVRATAQNLPKATKMALDVLKGQVEHAQAEVEKEAKQSEEQQKENK